MKGKEGEKKGKRKEKKEGAIDFLKKVKNSSFRR